MFNVIARRRKNLQEDRQSNLGALKIGPALAGAGEASPGDEEEIRPPEAAPAEQHAKLAEHHKAIAGIHEALADHHGGKGNKKLAAHHSGLAEYHHGAAAHNESKAEEAGEDETNESPSEASDEDEAEPAPGENSGLPEKHGISIALAFGKPKPPDTIESAKFGPPETEDEETPEHEAGESKEVEAIEEGRKESGGFPRKAGGTLRNSENEEPLSKSKSKGFHKFPKKPGERV